MTWKPRTEMKKDEYLLVGQGEYSSYGIVALLRFKRDCDLEKFAADLKERNRHGLVPWEHLLKELVTQNVAEELEHLELGFDHDIRGVE